MPVHRLEQFVGEMDRRAVAGRCHVQLSGIGFYIGDELGNVVGRDRRIDLQHVGHARHAGDRREVAFQIELGIVEERGVDRIHCGDKQQRVAVRRRRRDRFAGEIAGGAGPVLDDHRLAESAGYELSDQAGDNVGRAAGRESENQPDRAARIGLRACDTRQGRQSGGARRKTKKLPASQSQITAIHTSRRRG